MDSFNVTLKSFRELSASTRDFRFTRDDGADVSFEPGQFFRFVFEDEEGEFERSYSLCNFTDPNVMDLVVSTVDGGRASKVLFAAEEGLRAKVTGPFGRLVLPTELPQRLFLVATSVGIAPYMPMLAELAKRVTDREVHLIYGVRDYSEFIYGEFLSSYASQHDFFHLHLCVSRCEVESGVTESQHKGYVQETLFALEPNAQTDHILLCGNPKMIDDAYPELKKLGFGVKQVVREKYVFAKDKTTISKSELSDEQKALIAAKMAKYKKN